jgi:hypothetical protein
MCQGRGVFRGCVDVVGPPWGAAAGNRAALCVTGLVWRVCVVLLLVAHVMQDEG